MSQVRYINVYEEPVFALGCHGLVRLIHPTRQKLGSPVSNSVDSDLFAEAYYRGTGRRRLYRLRVTRKPWPSMRDLMR